MLNILKRCFVYWKCKKPNPKAAKPTTGFNAANFLIKILVRFVQYQTTQYF